MIGYSCTIPVKYDVDVFVAGGGPAGVAAAVAAARNGCSVYLAEGQGCLGGMGTAAMVPVFMQFSDGINMVAAGIGEKILTRLRAAGGTGYDNPYSIKLEVLKRVYDELLVDADVAFTFQTHLIAVIQEEGEVTEAVLYAKSGLFAVKAKMFIDCTGDGDLAAWAGAPYEKGDQDGNLMPGTLCSLWAGVNWDEAERDPTHKRMLEQAFRDKVFTVEDPSLPGMWRIGRTTGGGNIGHAFGVDGTDEVSLTQAFIEQRKRLVEYEHYYKKYLNGFADMELAATGSMMGIRETRRILGDYVLNLQDFESRAVFPDEIGRYCYPVDIHAYRPDKELHQKMKESFETRLRYKQGESYGIPYRTLTPQGLKNVLVAGRCISTDKYIQGSVRVMPGCFITGQAAGAAASIAIGEGTDIRGFDIGKLQGLLRKMGAYLPEGI